jgi:hypothetical protein
VQRNLVRICTAPDDEADEALTEGLRGVEIDSLDHASKELLGFVHRRMVDLDLDHPTRDALAVHHKRTWHHNQRLLFRDRALLEKITERTGRAVVLKGGAMASSAYYDDLGVRPLMDLDVLVDRDDVEPLVDWALADGWTVSKGLDTRDIYIVHHAIDLERDGNGALDLHWALLVQGRNPARDRAVLAAAVPATLGDVPIHIPRPSDLVFHTAAHAKPEGIRHIVDLITIIERHGDDIDWHGLGDDVIERRTITYTLRAFGLVEQVRPGTIPPAVVDRLTRAPRHWSDYAFHGEELGTRRDIARRLAADVAGRARGAGPVEKLRVARAMVRRFGQDHGADLTSLTVAFFRRGGAGLNEPRADERHS